MTMKILLPFVLSLAISTSTADSDGDTCKYGISEKAHQKYHDGKCYVFFFDQYERYVNARDVCRKYRGYLAMPKTKTINDLLANELTLMDEYYRYWIGLNDMQIEDLFKWEDGSFLREYPFNSWGKNEGPRYGFGHHAEDCVGLDKNGIWHDFVCKYYYAEEELPFVCEFYVGRRSTAMTKPPSTRQTTSVPTTTEATTTKPTTTTTTTTPTTTPTTTTTTPTTTPTTTTTTPTTTTPTTTPSTPVTATTTPVTATTTPPTPPTPVTATTAATTPEPSTTACPNLNCNLECGLSGFKTDDNGCFLCECDD